MNSVESMTLLGLRHGVMPFVVMTLASLVFSTSAIYTTVCGTTEMKGRVIDCVGTHISAGMAISTWIDSSEVSEECKVVK